MNAGLFGKDDVRGNVSIYRTPPVRLNKYVGSTRYSISHPFPFRPSVARAVLTCRIAENGYAVGQETLFGPTDMNSQSGYTMILRPNELVVIWCSASGIFNQLPNGNTAIFTAANWDVSFVVLG